MTTSNDSPSLLARIAQNGDSAAWNELVQRHGTAMYRAALAVARRPDRADDAVQEALLHVRLRADRFRDPGADGEISVRRWLQRLAANAAASLLTAERTRTRIESASARAVPLETGMNDQADEPAVAPAVMAEAMAAISAEDRRVILLKYVEQLDHHGLAQELQCSEVAARVRLHRAQERLRKRLAGAGIALSLTAISTQMNALAAECATVAPAASSTAAWNTLITSTRQPALPFHVVTGDLSPMTIASIAASVALFIAGAVITVQLIAAETPPIQPVTAPPNAVVPKVPGPDSRPVDEQAARTAAVDAGAAFACDMYAHFAKQPGNIFFSPTSLESALTMTMAGARGQTLAEMQTALHHTAGDSVHLGMGSLDKALVPGKDPDGNPVYLFASVNRLWGQQGYPFQPDFLTLLDRTYGAGLAALDFINQPEPSRLQINAWVQQQTHGAIKDLIDPGLITKETRLVLTNAVYFKAAWTEHGFKPHRTSLAPFTSPIGLQQVPMMSRSLEMPFADLGHSYLVALPFVNDQVEMILLVPMDSDVTARKGLRALEQRLTATTVTAWRKQARESNVGIFLPRFQMNWKQDLRHQLQAAGMRAAFEPNADLSGLHATREPICINQVIHQAHLAVDETGAEATATTAAGGLLGGDHEPDREIHCDRPFIILIRHVPTGAWLFLGRVEQPQTN